MSRFKFTNKDHNIFVTGYDRVTGVFIQIYMSECIDEIISINNLGVYVNPKVKDVLTEKQQHLLEETIKRFEKARQSGIDYPNLDLDTILRFADQFGFTNQKNAIRYKMQ